jgi:hypothetical protein
MGTVILVGVLVDSQLPVLREFFAPKLKNARTAKP